MIVVGLPVTMSGDEGAQARLTRRFGEQLASETALRVVYHDELMSTVDAEGSPPGPRNLRYVDDAAASFLQRYLDAQERLDAQAGLAIVAALVLALAAMLAWFIYSAPGKCSDRRRAGSILCRQRASPRGRRAGTKR
jgi:hypothetical protein